jgi:hypothetical protein
VYYENYKKNILLASTDLTNDLNYVEVSIIDQFECQAYYGDQLWNSMICAVGTTNQGICLVSCKTSLCYV